MSSRLTQYLFCAISLSLLAFTSGCSPTPPSQLEIKDLAKATLKKYFSSLIKFQAHTEADNQSMQNNAQAMLDSLGSNQSSDSTARRSEAQIESELVTQADAEVQETLKRVNIKVIEVGDPEKADLIAVGSQTIYWPISFEAADPGHADTQLILTMFVYRNAVGKWDTETKTLQVQAAGTSQEISESMLKQIGL